MTSRRLKPRPRMTGLEMPPLVVISDMPGTRLSASMTLVDGVAISCALSMWSTARGVLRSETLPAVPVTTTSPRRALSSLSRKLAVSVTATFTLRAIVRWPTMLTCTVSSRAGSDLKK